MEKNAAAYLECERADKWLCSQFPDHANALLLKGGLDRKKMKEV